MISDDLLTNPLVASLNAMPGAVLDGKTEYGELTLVVDAAQIVSILTYLKQKEGFERLVSITAVDWYPMEPRFEVVYHMHSIKTNRRLRLKAKVGSANLTIDSTAGIYRSADWFEREVFDLFGISFTGHPNLKRILMPDDWEGHPLRKDYPVHGYKYSYQSE
jgi:NADH-quinone oxidoreductase subunit C